MGDGSDDDDEAGIVADNSVCVCVCVCVRVCVYVCLRARACVWWWGMYFVHDCINVDDTHSIKNDT